MTVTKQIEQHGVPWEAEYGYAQAVRSGDTIYLSGQISHDADGNIVGEGDLEAQMRQSYANAETLLARYGAGFGDVVDEMIFVTDMDAAFGARVKMKDEIYGGRADVASTIVEIARLALPPLLVEIRLVARI